MEKEIHHKNPFSVNVKIENFVTSSLVTIFIIKSRNRSVILIFGSNKGQGNYKVDSRVQ